MSNLSLNKAAAYAGKAKADILKALKSNDPMKKLSGSKNEKGHWEINKAELDRVFGKKGTELVATGSENGLATPEKSIPTSALEVEVKMLREQIARMDQESEHEREQMADQIANLREQMGRQSTDHRQALAAITDQRPEKRGWFSFGRKTG